MLHRHRDALAQALEHGDHRRGVEQLVGAAQRRIGQRVVALAAALPRPLLAVPAVAEIAAGQPQDAGQNPVATRETRGEFGVKDFTGGTARHEHRVGGAAGADLLGNFVRPARCAFAVHHFTGAIARGRHPVALLLTAGGEAAQGLA